MSPPSGPDLLDVLTACGLRIGNVDSNDVLRALTTVDRPITLSLLPVGDARVQDVVPGATENHVRASISEELVVAAGPDHPIRSDPSGELLASLASKQGVIPSSAGRRETDIRWVTFADPDGVVTRIRLHEEVGGVIQSACVAGGSMAGKHFTAFVGVLLAHDRSRVDDDETPASIMDLDRVGARSPGHVDGELIIAAPRSLIE